MELGIDSGYRCYSDASHRDGVAGYGVIIVKLGVLDLDSLGSTRQIVHRESGKFYAEGSIEAELRAIVRGLKFVPDNQYGIAWTDLSSFKNMAECVGRRRRLAQYVGLFAAINAELLRTGLVIDYMNRKARAHEYTECHRMAIKELRAWAPLIGVA